MFTHMKIHTLLKFFSHALSNCVDMDQLDKYNGKGNILPEWPHVTANNENKKSMRNDHNAS